MTNKETVELLTKTQKMLNNRPVKADNRLWYNPETNKVEAIKK